VSDAYGLALDGVTPCNQKSSRKIKNANTIARETGGEQVSRQFPITRIVSGHYA
jgi:hypothetical protein